MPPAESPQAGKTAGGAGGDRLVRFLLAGGSIRGAVVDGSRLVADMRRRHELGILETVVLGRAFLGLALLSSGLKGADRLALQISCTGPIRGLSVEANAAGELRGFLEQVPIPVEGPLEDLDLRRFFGAGLLSVTRVIEGARRPFTGRVELRYGNLALDLAHYCLVSEQIPTAFNLSVPLDREGRVPGAGGLMLQAMPEAEDRVLAELEALVADFPSLGERFARGETPGGVIESAFAPWKPTVLDSRPVAFRCPCHRARIESLLHLLPIQDLKEMRDVGPFPIEIRCRNCGARYPFQREEIARIYGSRYPDN
ncbi:MAG: Hsp33 family molecular chaperone HslO [Desulfobacterales bacterium]